MVSMVGPFEGAIEGRRPGNRGARPFHRRSVWSLSLLDFVGEIALVRLRGQKLTCAKDRCARTEPDGLELAGENAPCRLSGKDPGLRVGRIPAQDDAHRLRIPTCVARERVPVHLWNLARRFLLRNLLANGVGHVLLSSRVEMAVVLFELLQQTDDAHERLLVAQGE